MAINGMKFRISSPAMSEEIQRALFEMGYTWYSYDELCGQDVSYGDAPYLFSEDSGQLKYGYFDETFEKSNYVEHFLAVGGAIVDASYFTQPQTAAKDGPYWEVYEDKLQDTQADALLAMKKRFDSTKPPIGLKPRKEHDQARLVEIAEALVRYAQAGKKVDSQWIAELSYLNEIVGE